MKWKPNHIVPWILLVTVFALFFRGAEQEGTLVLYMLSVYALADISRSKGEGAMLLCWCIYACAVDAILHWQSCIYYDWVLALLSGGAICALLFLARWIWKHLI